jgi:hypothetical protein
MRYRNWRKRGLPDQLSDYFARIGRKGGFSRARKLTPEHRKASALKRHRRPPAKKRTAKAKKARKG